MAISLEEYNQTMEQLRNSRKVSLSNRGRLDVERLMVVAMKCENKNNEELRRLMVKLNDRYFINEDIIDVLTQAIIYLQQEKDMDSVFDNYMGMYSDLVKQFKQVSNSPEFKDLANKYIPNTEVKNV